MRWLFPTLICWLAGIAAFDSAFSQDKAAAPQKGAGPVFAQVGKGTAQEYQKDNPLLKTDLNQVSNFQGKMYETKEFKPKGFGTQVKDQPVVLNKMFTQTSTLTANKNTWESKEADSLKKSDMTGKQSTFAEKRVNMAKDDVTVKMVKGFDGKMDETKKATGFSEMLSDGQKRYKGPESPEVSTEMEMIQERLKKADTPEDLKKNELTTDEVQKLLQPRQPMTRAK